MFSFLEQNNYHIEWENDYFAIFLPSKAK